MEILKSDQLVVFVEENGDNKKRDRHAEIGHREREEKREREQKVKRRGIF